MLRNILLSAVCISSLLSAAEPTATITKKSVYDSNIAKTTIIMFTGSHCGPCKKMKPCFYVVAEKHADIAFVTFETNTTDKELNKIMDSLNIRSVPTLVFFKNGKEIMRTNKPLSASEIESKIAEFKKITETPEVVPAKVPQQRSK